MVNQDKFQVIMIDKKKGDHSNKNVVIDFGWTFGNSVRW